MPGIIVGIDGQVETDSALKTPTAPAGSSGC
jgi:hypothetical protein